MANAALLKFAIFDAYQQASKLHAATQSVRIPMARKIQLLAKVINIINSPP